MQWKQNQCLQTLSFPRQETVSIQMMQLEGCSSFPMPFLGKFVLFLAFLWRDMFRKFLSNFAKWRLWRLSNARPSDWLRKHEPIKFVDLDLREGLALSQVVYYPLARAFAVSGRKENMADIASMLVTTGIESPNKRAKMDSGLLATNFDESKFARYYRTEAVKSPTSSDSPPVVGNTSAYYSYPYTYANSFTGYSFPYGHQTDNPSVYTYPASYGYNYTQLNGYSPQYSGMLCLMRYGEIH